MANNQNLDQDTYVFPKKVFIERVNNGNNVSKLLE